MQGSVLESVFASKLTNQVSYKDKPKEDIAMKDVSASSSK